MKLNSPVSYLRVFSILDACSWLYLIYAMYHKYILGDLSAVRIPGMIHGIIFCIFGAALLLAWKHKKWSWKIAFLIGFTSLIPFLPFWLETWLKKQDS